MTIVLDLVLLIVLLAVCVLVLTALWRHRHGTAERFRDAVLTLLGQPTPSGRAHAEWLKTPEGQAHIAAAKAREAARFQAEEEEEVRQRIRDKYSGPPA